MGLISRVSSRTYRRMEDLEKNENSDKIEHSDRNFNFDPAASVFIPTSYRYRSSTIDDFSSSNSKTSSDTSSSFESEIKCESDFSTKSEFATSNSKSPIYSPIQSSIHSNPKCSTTIFQNKPQNSQNKSNSKNNSKSQTNFTVPIATATKIVSIVSQESESLKITRQKYEALENEYKIMKLREIEHLKAFSYCQFRMMEQQRIIEKLQRENVILNRKFQSE